jgi:signal transduction histidine kinase
VSTQRFDPGGGRAERLTEWQAPLRLPRLSPDPQYGLAALLAAVPLGLLVFFKAVPQSDVLIVAPALHEVAIGGSVATTGLIGALTLRAHVATGRLNQLGLGTGLLAFAAVYLWHGVFTGAEHPFIFLIYGPLARAVLAAFLFGFAVRETIVPLARRRRLAIAGLMGAVVAGGMGLGLSDPIAWLASSQPPAAPNTTRLAVEALALLLALGASIRIWLSRDRSGWHGPALPLGALLSAEQSLCFLPTTAWTLLWWIAHLVGATATFVLAWAALVDEERARQLVSERAARQEAEAAVRLRDEFLSVAAHELKTPMAGLQLAVQHLLRRLDKGAVPEPGQLRQSLHAVDQQAAKASRLVAQLLETSRLEAGRLALERRAENLLEIVAGVVEQARARTSRHDLVLSAPPEVRAFVDALRLEQVLTNLLDNAIKFSPQGGRIDVEVAALDDGRVRLAVRDRGLGIPPEHRGRIFERFHQAHAAEHRSGLGLGLYVSRGIVELHGGRIWAEFPPDGGTRFVVTLPTGTDGGPNRPEETAWMDARSSSPATR